MTNRFATATPHIAIIDALPGGGAYLEGVARDDHEPFMTDTDTDSETIAFLIGCGFDPSEIASAPRTHESEPH